MWWECSFNPIAGSHPTCFSRDQFFCKPMANPHHNTAQSICLPNVHFLSTVLIQLFSLQLGSTNALRFLTKDHLRLYAAGSNKATLMAFFQVTDGSRFKRRHLSISGVESWSWNLASKFWSQRLLQVESVSLVCTVIVSPTSPVLHGIGSIVFFISL